MELTLKLTAQSVEDLIRAGLPVAAEAGVRVESVAPGSARIRLPFHPGMLRPGGVISGPTLFTAAQQRCISPGRGRGSRCLGRRSS